MIPTTAQPTRETSPASLLIYGPPKVGKTHFIGQLSEALVAFERLKQVPQQEAIPYRLLHIGTEIGSLEGVSGYKLEASNLKSFKSLASQLQEQYNRVQRQYGFVVIDTVDSMELIAEELALEMYKSRPMGKNFDGQSVLELERGGGYFWLREAFKTMENWIKPYAKRIIYIGHVKDKSINKSGTEVSARDVNLTGKIAQILCSHTDAIGFMYREEGKVTLSFRSDDESIVCGCRQAYLAGKVLTNPSWDEIYPELGKVHEALAENQESEKKPSRTLHLQ